MTDKKIKIYTTPTCSYCQRAKQFLTDHKVKFENIDVSADQAKAKEMTDLSGQMGVPVLDIGGEIVVGFDKEKISQTLGI